MDAALSPLIQMGIRILNYPDDWLILAQSEVELLSHRTLILSHLERLGLRVNFAKSALSLSQRVSFLGTVLDSAHMRVVIAPECALAIQKLAATFKSDTARPLKVFQRMLGLMAAASPVLQLGLLRMRPLQRWLKPRVPHNAWHHGRDLLSQANGTIWHPRPELWALYIWPLNGSLLASQNECETPFLRLEPRL